MLTQSTSTTSVHHCGLTLFYDLEHQACGSTIRRSTVSPPDPWRGYPICIVNTASLGM